MLVLVLLAPKLYLDCKYSSILNLKTGHFLEKSWHRGYTTTIDPPLCCVEVNPAQLMHLTDNHKYSHIIQNLLEAKGSLEYFDQWSRRPSAAGGRPWAVGRPLVAFFAKADSHHHVCLDGVAISTIVVAGARGGRIWSQLKSIYLNCTWIPNYLQLSHNPVDCKKRDPRLRQDFKIPKMALSAIVGVRLDCRGPSSMGWSLPSTPDQKPVGGPLG